MMTPEQVEWARRNSFTMPRFQEFMTFDVFKAFMTCECVAILEIYLDKCIRDEYYEGAAFVRDLLKDRKGKLEMKGSNKVPVYFP